MTNLKHSTKLCVFCHNRGTSNVLWEQKREEINFSWKVKESFVEEAGIELGFEKWASFYMWYYGVAWSWHPKRELHEKKVIALGIYILGFRNRFSVSGLVCMEKKTEWGILDHETQMLSLKCWTLFGRQCRVSEGYYIGKYY